MINILFFGSEKYSDIVLNTLQKDRRLKILKIITDKKSLEEIKKTKPRPDVGILASFGAIVPKDILNFPKKGILNLHPSLLPKYRGTSPIQFTLLNGEKETGITIIKMDEKVDHGPIVSQSQEKVLPEDTAKSLYERLFTLGAKTLLTILPAFLEGKIELRPQDHSQATYTKRLTREDGEIDWKKPDDFNERFIRAIFPWPGAWTLLRSPSFGGQAKRLKILKAHLEKGKLFLDQVQLEGKKPVSFKQFLEGYPEVKIT